MRDGIGHAAYSLLGMVRRVLLGPTAGGIWQAIGVKLIDQTTPETFDADVFSGGWLYFRPEPGANAEALSTYCGDAQNPVIFAVRHEDLRKLAAKDLAQGEGMACNKLVALHLTKDGHIDARTLGGAAVKLPTLADFNALADVVEDLRGKHNSHVHPDPQGGATGATTQTSNTAASHATGTTAFRAE